MRGTLSAPLYESKGLPKAIDDIYRYPLQTAATDTLNRQLRSGISDDDLVNLVISLRDENHLCLIHDGEPEEREPKIICSLRLTNAREG